MVSGVTLTLPELIQRHWSHLCETIGERRAGSPGDRAAGGYLIQEFRAAGLQNTHAEAFECVSVVHAEAELAIGTGSKLQAVPARVLAGSPSSKGTRPIEADLVWIEMPEQAQRLLRPELRGRIVILVGPMPTRADLHRRLVASRPAAVIHVDDRLPFEWVKDDGVYPAWVKRYGMPPTVTIPYRTAWNLRKTGADRARVCIKVRLEKRVCNNIVAEAPGRRADLPVVLIGAHHDTQCNNTGADDNGSGVVALITLASRLANARLLRTIRFVSFGAEEQLSVGSAEYVRTHRREMDSIGVVLNLDSISSPLGHHWLLRAGSGTFGSWLVTHLAKHGLDVVEKPLPMPFADHFPFSAFGVPAVTFMRPNMDGGMRWQHHSDQDNLENVSAQELLRVIEALGAVARELATASRLPFSGGIPQVHRAETKRLAKELFGFRSVRAGGALVSHIK